MTSHIQLFQTIKRLRIFSHDIEFTLNISESQFIHWFSDNVRPLNASLTDKRIFVGELDKCRFWLHPKPEFLLTNDANLYFKEWNFAEGTYNVNEKGLLFKLTVELNVQNEKLSSNWNDHMVISRYLSLFHWKTGIFLEFGGFTSILLIIAIRRVRQDPYYYKKIAN